MIVIADTTPFNYLILTDLIHILSALFGQVILPQAVLNELQSTQAPDKVRQWFRFSRVLKRQESKRCRLDAGYAPM